MNIFTSIVKSFREISLKIKELRVELITTKDSMNNYEQEMKNIENKIRKDAHIDMIKKSRNVNNKVKSNHYGKSNKQTAIKQRYGGRG
jgi:hypothetical protein